MARGRKKARVFILAFAGAFLTLLSLAAIVVYYTNPIYAEKSESSASADEYYLPDSDDDMTILVICTGREPFFFAVGFDPIAGKIPVAPFPKQTVVNYAGKPYTLEEIYNDRGAKAVKIALSETAGIAIDRFVIFSPESLANTVNAIGEFEYVLPQSLNYTGEDFSIILEAGNQIIDGRKFYGIMAYPLYENSHTAMETYGKMAVNFINQKLPRAADPDGELFSKVINDVESDISYNDFNERKNALAFMARLASQPAFLALVNGSFNSSQNSFTLAQSAIDMLKTVFKPAQYAVAESN